MSTYALTMLKKSALAPFKKGILMQKRINKEKKLTIYGIFLFVTLGTNFRPVKNPIKKLYSYSVNIESER